MEEIMIGAAQKLTAPAPFGLLSTRKADGSSNLMAISWWTYLSNHPPMLGVCLSKKGLSGTLIEANGQFTLSIVGDNLKEKAIRCGACSGRNHDKAAEFGIPLEDARHVDCQVVSGSRVVFECVRKSQIEAGDHMLYLAEIVGIQGDPSVKQLFAFDGYARLDSLK